MKTHIASISVAILTLVSGIAGYLLRASRTDGSLVLQAQDVPEEYFASPDSFSRVENTKNALDALCARLRVKIQESTAAYDKLARNGPASSSQAAVFLEGAIRDSQTIMRQFEGTEQQLDILPDHLRLLERAGRLDVWTHLYVQALYEHPTHLMVSRLAKDAVKISKLAGQPERVLNAFRYLCAGPEEFAGKREIQAALSAGQPYLAKIEAQPEQGVLAAAGKFELK